MMIYGCSKSSAVRTRERVNQHLKRPTGSQITIQDLSIYNGFHPSNIFWSFHYKTRLFIYTKDIECLFPFRKRRAQFYINAIKKRNHVKSFSPITVFECAEYFNLKDIDLFALLNTQHPPTYFVNNRNELTKNEMGALNEMEIPKRKYYAESEFSDFWKENETKFSDPVWNFPKFFALDPIKLINKPF